MNLRCSVDGHPIPPPSVAMGELLRSMPMQMVQLFVQVEAAHDTVDELAELGVVQFCDMNPNVNSFQRNFVNEVRRADEMERQLRLFEKHLELFATADPSFKARINGELIPEEEIIVAEEGDVAMTPMMSRKSGTALMDELEAMFGDLEKELNEIETNQTTLDRNANELLELSHVLDADESFFGASNNKEQQDITDRSVIVPETGSGLSFINGVIARTKVHAFERILWRVARGNIFFRFSPIEEPIRDSITKADVEKDVFLVMFQGQRLQEKITKVCETFGCHVFSVPQDSEERAVMRRNVSERKSDLKVVLDRTRDHTLRVLTRIVSHLDEWKETILKEKAIYHTMNLFNYDVGRKCLMAEAWCPKVATEEIQLAMRRATDKSGAMVPSILNIIETNEVPPTHFKTNKMTSIFQDMTNSYGVPRYREINPTPFNIAMFPFLFGVMFGDVGHGFILLLASLFFIVNEEKLLRGKLNEMIEMVFQGRYLLFCLALAAIYCGFMYNECFVVPMDIFGTAWEYLTNESGEPISLKAVYKPEDERFFPRYPFGIDPLWVGSENQLSYTDSVKMKMSVIFGVTQMAFGIALSICNAVFHEHWYEVAFHGVPQMIFLLSVFGYMDLLIIVKWVTDWSNVWQVSEYHNWEVPLLLNVMIQMFLSPFSLDPQFTLYRGQLVCQFLLILIAALCVPVMLLGVPLWRRREYQLAKQNRRGISLVKSEDGDYEEEEGDDLQFDMGEEMVQSMIHTIEFVLGAISNTASYLRLWALSLAHSQLSEVFLGAFKVTLLGFASGFLGSVGIFMGFAVWSSLTIGVLIVMESLSAFLHALRLHWVEFQNKFYAADGHAFMPLSWEALLRGDEEAIAALSTSS